MSEHSPMESYQWSAARVEHTSRFVKQLGVVVGTVLLVATIAVLIWNTAVFGSQVEEIQQTTSAHNLKLSCETAAFDNIISQLAVAQQAEAHHLPPPHFTYPKPC